MSTSVEQRIVEMKFDNKGFAEGVQDTLKDLDTLDKATKFEGGVQGLKSLQRSADNLNFTAILNGIQSISESLDNMQSFGFQVFQNLTNKAIDMATNVVKSLSVDQIKGGFSEYELKMDSVRTIMNSSGASLDTVNQKLQELNEYSDRTIYSFSDMTSSIGKFTNAGVGLDDAVAAIQGISNEAAISGANAQQASAAMYNFAQALSSGSVKLIDWKSIENANMATVEFKQSLLDTAVALGTVKKTEDGYISTTTDANGKTSDIFTSTLGFNDALSSQWMTTEVLTQTLQNYATDTREMTEEERKAWKEKMISIGYTEEQIEKIERLGQRAFDSAQEVTTFSKMMEALKESVGSGWAQTFEILFGDLEHAKKLWTGINDVISGVIASISDTRNGILEMWKAAGGHTYILEGLKEIWAAFENIAKYVGLALETLSGHRYLQNLTRVKEFFADRKTFSGNLVTIQKISTVLENVSQKFFDLARKIRTVFNPNTESGLRLLHEIYQTTQAIIIPIRFILKIITGIAEQILPVIFKVAVVGLRLVIFLISRVGYALTEGGLYKSLYALADLIVNVFGKSISWLFNTLTGLADTIAKAFGFESALDALISLGDALTGVFANAIGIATDAVGLFTKSFGVLKEILDPIISLIGTGLTDAFGKLRDFWTSDEQFSKLKESVRGFFASFKGEESKEAVNTADKIKSRAGELIQAGYNINDAWSIARDTIKEVDGASSFFTNISAKIQVFVATIRNSNVLKSFNEMLEQLKANIVNSQIGQSITKFFEPLTTAWKEVFGNSELTSQLGLFGNAFKIFIEQLKNLDESSLKSVFSGIGAAFMDLFGNLKQAIEINGAELITKISEFWKKLTSGPEEGAEENPEGGGLFTYVSNLIKGGLNGLVNGIKEFSWDKLVNALKSALGLYFLKTAFDLFHGVDSVAVSFKKTVSYLKGIVKNIAGVIAMTKWQIAADAILTVAKSFAVLTGCIFVLSLIPQEGLDKAITTLALVAVIAGLFLFVKAKIDMMVNAAKDSESESEGLSDAAKGLLANIKAFGDKFIDAIKKSLFIAAIGIFVVALAIAVGLLVKVLKDINGISWPEFASGIAKMGILILTLVATIGLLEYMGKQFGNDTQFIQMALFLLAFTGSIKKLAKDIEMLAAMSWDTYKSGILKMAGILVLLIGSIWAFQQFVDGVQVKGMGVSLILMAGALLLMMVPITMLANMPLGSLIQSLVALVVVLGVLAGLSVGAVALQKWAGGMKEFAVAILGIIGVAVGIYIFAEAITLLASQSENIQQHALALTVLAVAILGFTAILGVIGKVLGPQLLMVGGAILMFGAGLYLAATAVKVFAEAAVLFATSMDAIIKAVQGREEQVTTAISTIVYAAVKGLMDGLVYALAALIGGIDDALIILDQHAFSIAEHLTTTALKIIGGVLVGILKAIGDAFGFVGRWITDKLTQKLDEDGEAWEEKASKDASNLTESNERHTLPAATQAALATKGAYSAEIGNSADADIWDAFMQGQAGNITTSSEQATSAMKEAGKSADKAYFDSLNGSELGAERKYMQKSANEIRENTPEVQTAAEEAGNAVSKGLDVTDEVSTNNQTTVDLMSNLPIDIQNVMNNSGPVDTSALYSALGQDAAEGGDAAIAQNELTIDKMKEMFGNDLDMDSVGLDGMSEYAASLGENRDLPLAEVDDTTDQMMDAYMDKDYGEGGKYSDEQLAQGLEEEKGVVTDAAKSVSSDGANAAGSMDSIWYSNAWNLVQGLANGIIDNSHIAEDAGREMTRNTLDAMQEEADEHSPSKETYKFAYFMVKGMANGFDENGDILERSARSTTRSALDTLRNTMLEATSMLDDSFDGYSPTITPVLDSSQIQYGMRGLNDILNGAPYANIGANVSVGKVDVGSAVGELSSLTSQGNSDLLDALRAQSRQTEHLIYLLENQKIYLDGNTLVGKTISRIDNALGQRAVLAGRRG